MKSIRNLVLFWTTLLAVGAFAVQYPTNPSSGQQPGQQPQTQRPPEPPSPQGQAPAQPGHPTIDDQVKMLTSDLDLKPDQQAKMRSILEEQHQQAMAIVDDNTLPRDEKIQKIRALREVTIAKTRTMLNDDQKKKLDDMLAEPQEARPPGGQQPGSNPPSGTNPPPSSTPPSSRPPSF